MANPLSRAFDALSDSAISLIIFVMVLALGAIQLADFGAEIDTDYGNTSTAAQVVDEGEAGVLDLADSTDMIVGAIVLVVIVLLLILVKRQTEAS